MLVENCTSEGHAGLGLHPGSGSQRPVIRNNRLVGNDIGLFFCWGVRQGIAEGNHIEGNRVGISIGHHDTDNLVTGNEILGSRDVGVLFRPERGQGFRRASQPHREEPAGRQRLRRRGSPWTSRAARKSIVLADNEIVDTRGGARRVAIRLGPETRDITLRNNRIQGFAQAVSGPQGGRDQ